MQRLPEMRLSNVWEHNALAYQMGKRFIINQGGTSSSKTFSILQLLIIIAISTTTQLLISVVSESLPHLKRGCIRDFQEIMGDAFEAERWNKTDHLYHFDKSVVEFFPADDAAKLRGGRRDILFENECNNLTLRAHDELSVRTRKAIFLDYNPVSDFWAHELISHEAGLPEADRSIKYIHSTYLDAKDYLPAQTVKDIESRRGRDPNWWRV